MKLDELQMHPAPISDIIFLGRIKSNIYVEKIDFTEQFYKCLAELCVKQLRKSDSVTFSAEIIDGTVVEIKAYIKS
ncbi:hypothetical protein [Campylobacter hyointestinalis]|uniref:hypothetical protein n=1 Tax=Campylobacter hyointestinalis TaxID=198 RepID=UPI000DCBA301|nr:hypothetical protein [Campylobacter hyointestinalis]RAZ49192.1 hypothetical protein CHL9004_07870 [Campylobacter hyointestinalis subsp. lawsonii]